MMRILAVYGIDSSYGERFADYVNQKEKIPFTAMAFSNLEKLLQYSKEHAVEILLVDEEAREQVREDLKHRFTGEYIPMTTALVPSRASPGSTGWLQYRAITSRMTQSPD